MVTHPGDSGNLAVDRIESKEINWISPEPESHHYEAVIPIAWRLLALASYLSGFFGLNLIIPFAVWLLFRNRYLRSHAINAGIIQGAELIICALFYLANLLFIIESEVAMVSLLQLLGSIFSNSSEDAITLLILQSMIFLIYCRREAKRLSQHPVRSNRADPERLQRHGFTAVLIAPFLFYNNLFWPSSGSLTLELIDYGHFQNPLVLLPGHLALLAALRLSLLAIDGKVYLLYRARSLYLKFLRAEKLQGEARRKAARLRALLIPGWGLFYSGQRLAGLGVLALSATLSFLFALGLLFQYSALVSDSSGLNANAPWYFLSELGLRSAIGDEPLQKLFSTWLPVTILGLLLLTAYLVSWRATEQLYRSQAASRFRQLFSLATLIHLLPFIFVTIVPVSFVINSRVIPEFLSEEPLEIIPEFFEKSNDMALDGGVWSGEDGKDDQTIEMKHNTPTPSSDLTTRSKAKQTRKGKKSESQEAEESIRPERPGKRQAMTYSNYLSARIRGVEKTMNYWEDFPEPFAAVTEYKISRNGQLFDVRILESSGYPEYDELTLQLIRRLGILLPPPTGRAVVVTELFWNTGPGDNSLDTPLKRQLSHAFDGRVIEPF